ncbi:hypothetical protein [Flavobacterium aurantiibacter]|uniref:Uncharacterized protein n=1 Tax=Flavobacterium aurantiibacter TaxID=2023067 RepID=A0A255ZL05_9FLAO|nr:hypothetical protein [Flavobacterium aurantiibacter]OYQ41555.1 hypothetical protein CHX27_12855 [Flavobacterium aurantiibacter]
MITKFNDVHPLIRNRVVLKIIFFAIFFNFILSCSSTDEVVEIINETPPEYYIAVDGVKTDFSTIDNPNLSVTVYNDAVVLGATLVGATPISLSLTYTKSGDFLRGTLFLYEGAPYNNQFNFRNYQNFPANFMQVHNFEINDVNNTLTIDFEGKLYSDVNNLASYHRNIRGILNKNFVRVNENLLSLFYQSIPQYCTALINGESWVAKEIGSESTFTAEDDYRFIIHIAENTPPGSFEFDPNSIGNYVKFQRFNLNSNSFEDYIVSGVISYSYREFHGARRYSHIGTFSFLATNPNNPAETIQVTDGVFRNFQTY